MKISKIAAVSVSCDISKLECTKLHFGWGSAPDPDVRAFSTPPDHLAVFNEAY